ncbi:glycine cleavage system H-protein [Dictyostelium discoideum AX4]|uniref:Glycine cleavage system H-like protein gcvH5, mitochondrial n=1 Tax=Dictyostelium discoideum TaxID=44689 RepID=GCSH5_DICDI|nr:glycine cleavage system H-protein [Dictyostelium discoideum AX4]Q54JU0.1 RecName: Full=Glycine cleavage system H-like protein gcvH5, mitochondrial; Flags: Precursor [Dictyostelium discoideum]EAL63577.1 glycine cleavage system H-protein [Dictyostelium discoideum AX4]|eukprot:XP_637062.1 glycine cleavage system H-protein [Dictyostelium discoideum AX4]
MFLFKTTNNLRKSLSNKFFCTRYSKNHLWISINNNNNSNNNNNNNNNIIIGTLGLTENGPINKFDDVLYIKFPIIKDENQVDDEPLTISLDTISDQILLNSPIRNCKLISINQDVLDYPNYINSSPMSKGWLCKIKFSNINDFNSLMNKNEYDNYCKNKIIKI